MAEVIHPPTDVSVIIAVRDGSRYLVEALTSVTDQTRPAAQIIVVDDGSTDGSAELASRTVPWARIVRQAPTGYAAAVNHAVSVATGSVLAFLDADDRWSPDSLARRLHRLDGEDSPEIVVGATQNFLSPDLSDAEASAIRIHTRAFRAEVLAAALIRADAFDRVGPLDESLRTGSAIDWMSRARSSDTTFAFVDEVVLHRRLHASNLGRSNQDDRNADLLRVVRAHHARQRPT